MLLHETRARGVDVMARLRTLRVTVCGAGALGANLVETLARCGFARLRVIDRDRVEERNLSTQPWHRGDVGGQKARLLAHALHAALRVPVEAHPVELTAANARKLLADSDLVVDAFDNSASRAAVRDACATTGIPCLHVGLAAGYAEVLWDDQYRVPSPAQDDVCDYPLARALVLVTIAVATEAIVDHVATGSQRGWTITLADLAVRPYQ